MRRSCHRLVRLLPLLLLLPGLLHAAEPAAGSAPFELEFSGYKFGQSPSANMVCRTGYCKSQAPGGDGRVTFPFSVYETPGAVTTLGGLTVVNPAYTFWEDHLFRVYFQVDCTPLETEACLDDIVKALDREYGLLPISSSDSSHFTLHRRTVFRDFLSAEGALIKVRAISTKGEWLLPSVEIVDKQTTDLVGSTLNPSFKAKKLPIPDDFGKNPPRID